MFNSIFPAFGSMSAIVVVLVVGGAFVAPVVVDLAIRLRSTERLRALGERLASRFAPRRENG